MRTKRVNTIFSNTDELLSLYETPHFDEALDALRAEGVLGVVTRSEKGCVVVEGGATWAAPTFPIAKLIDTTGAGDMFAAGFLAGLARGADMTTCGRLGAFAAAEIIQHLGARPNVSLKALAKETGIVLAAGNE
jgi:sugar/nucleoside kinase (ribokinase family)